MASRKKYQRNAVELPKIHLLSLVISLCMLLLLLVIGLQFYNLFHKPVDPSEIPSVLGSASLPFRLTTVRIFPFLLLPLLALIACFLYLQSFFTKHGNSTEGIIPSFSKHPGTKTGKLICNGFAGFAAGISLVLCIFDSVFCSFHGNWVGFPVAAAAAYLLYQSGKLLRKRKRQYLHHKKRVIAHGSAHPVS